MKNGEGICCKCHKRLRWGTKDRPYGWIAFTDYIEDDYDGKECLCCEKCFKEIFNLANVIK